MKPIRSILVPLISPQSRRIIKNAILLSTWLRADLHVMVRDRSKLAPAKSKIGPLRFIHIWTSNFLSEFLDSVEAYDVDLVVLDLEAAMQEVSTTPLSLEKRILEKCPVPILLTTHKKSLDRTSINSLLVAISGERRNNEALDLAIHLANTARIPVDILHVTPAKGPCSCEAVLLEATKDQFHHEYPRMVEQLAAQASPFSNARDRRCIRDFLQCNGDVTDEIIKSMHSNPKAMLVLEWNGVLAKGRAETLRKILTQSLSPVLLTKSHIQPRARLKVGSRIET